MTKKKVRRSQFDPVKFFHLYGKFDPFCLMQDYMTDLIMEDL